MDFSQMSPVEFRAMVARGDYKGGTENCCNGYAQANLVVLPEKYARDFQLFCERNPKPCPILEITKPGEMYTSFFANHACIASDIPMYRVFRNGECVEETSDVTKYWKDDFVSFLIGCSCSFEEALIKAGIEIRSHTDKHVCSLYKTSIPCAPGGIFEGNVVTSMRPVHKDQLDLAYKVTGAIPHVHGCPIYHGDPSKIGVDLSKPDWGSPSRFEEGEVPVFWACGVTPQLAMESARPEFAITHKPGGVLVGDILSAEIEEKLKSRSY